MRYESSVTSVSWIPSEAVGGSTRLAFEAGITHYDDPPRDHLDDVEAPGNAGRFRFANLLRGWIEADDSGRITDCGYSGRGLITSAVARIGTLQRRFQPSTSLRPGLTARRRRVILAADGMWLDL